MTYRGFYDAVVGVPDNGDEHEADAVPDPDCCPGCYRRYWAMVEAGEIAGTDMVPLPPTKNEL